MIYNKRVVEDKSVCVWGGMLFFCLLYAYLLE